MEVLAWHRNQSDANAMTCPTCQKDSSHIRINVDGTMGCHNCMGFSETGGTKTDKILTRNATRITEQQIQHEGDMITPYVVDKSTNQVVPNEDFVALYPNQAAQTYSKDELKSIGQEGLTPEIDIDDGQGIEFVGDEKEAIHEIVEEAQAN